MNIDLVAFFYLLLAVGVFLYYSWNKGRKKRPSLAEEVGFEELTIEQALNNYDPITAANLVPAHEVVTVNPKPEPLPIKTTNNLTPVKKEEESLFIDYESQIIEQRKLLRKKTLKKAYKGLSKKMTLFNVKKPFVFNLRDAIIYDTIWKRKY